MPYRVAAMLTQVGSRECITYSFVLYSGAWCALRRASVLCFDRFHVLYPHVITIEHMSAYMLGIPEHPVCCAIATHTSCNDTVHSS
jgi:hypothetical protein